MQVFSAIIYFPENFEDFNTYVSRARGVPRDPRFVFRAFYSFCLRFFFHRHLSNCLTIEYASFDEK